MCVFKRADTNRHGSLLKLKKEVSITGRGEYHITVTEASGMILSHNGELDGRTKRMNEGDRGGGRNRGGRRGSGRYIMMFV